MSFIDFLIISVAGAIAVSMSGCDSNSQVTDGSDKDVLVSPYASGNSETIGTTEPESESEEITEAQTSQIVIPIPEFSTDLSEYEKYMNPGDTTEYLIVVSREHTLLSTYEPTDRIALIDTRKDGRTTQTMREYAAKAMEAMFIEMRAAGYTDVSITSAYRSYVYQESIFNMYLAQNNNDYEYVSTFSNPPGSSEHQTGLCADLHNLSSADVKFGNTEAFAWLRDNCWKFGYILRYPEDKVEVTSISYEPWHYRYVGRYHAKRMYDEGLCLEEYVGNYYPELLA